MRRAAICTIWAFFAVVAMGFAAARAETLGTSSTSITAASSRTRETVAGNLIADAVKASARADAAIIPADALSGGEVAKGNLSRGDLKSLLEDPDDTVTTISLTGEQLKAVLERGVSACPKPFDGFLQVSGLMVEYAADKDVTPRVLMVKLGQTALDDTKRYKVATLKSLSSGGLGYYNLWDQKDVVESGVSELDALANYVKAQKTISPREEGRISAK